MAKFFFVAGAIIAGPAAGLVKYAVPPQDLPLAFILGIVVGISSMVFGIGIHVLFGKKN